MSETSPEQTQPDLPRRYLQLLKQSLTFTLWDEPGFPIDLYKRRTAAPVRFILSGIAGVLKILRLQLVRLRNYSPETRAEGRMTPLMADTMVGLKRLDNVQQCLETVLEENIPGDVIETGVWRGGTCIFMRGILAAYDDATRRVFVADSFAGLPPPDENTYAADKGDEHYLKRYLAVSRDQVAANFRRYGLLDDRVIFLEGWFKDTLPELKAEQLAIIRLDGDMYESTMDGFNNLYHKLSPGGFCIIDDYGLAGCRQAVDEFRENNHITAPLHRIDWTGVYWRKPLGTGLQTIEQQT